MMRKGNTKNTIPIAIGTQETTEFFDCGLVAVILRFFCVNLRDMLVDLPQEIFFAIGANAILTFVF